MDDLVKLVLSQTGLVGALVALFIGGLYTGRVVWGSQCEAEKAGLREQLQTMTEDRNDWKGMALRLLGHSTKAVDIAHSTTVKGG